jgi:hypothetical protein
MSLNSLFSVNRVGSTTSLNPSQEADIPLNRQIRGPITFAIDHMSQIRRHRSFLAGIRRHLRAGRMRLFVAMLFTTPTAECSRRPTWW